MADNAFRKMAEDSYYNSVKDILILIANEIDNGNLATAGLHAGTLIQQLCEQDYPGWAIWEIQRMVIKLDAPSALRPPQSKEK